MNKDKGAVKDWLNNADILTGALPYMQKYNGSIIVIKYGGNAMADSDLVAVSYTHLTLPTKA